MIISRKISRLEQTWETDSNHEMPDTSRINYSSLWALVGPYIINDNIQGSKFGAKHGFKGTVDKYHVNMRHSKKETASNLNFTKK